MGPVTPTPLGNGLDDLHGNLPFLADRQQRLEIGRIGRVLQQRIVPRQQDGVELKPLQRAPVQIGDVP